MEPPPVDYRHVRELYEWCARSKGGGWFFLPSYVFALIGLTGIVLYFFLHHWAFGLMVVFGFAASEKRAGIKEGFVLGYETAYYEYRLSKKDLSKN